MGKENHLGGCSAWKECRDLRRSHAENAPGERPRWGLPAEGVQDPRAEMLLKHP